MPPRTLAYVTPDVLRWARESSGYSLKDAARRVRVVSWRLELAEEGQDYLTLRQAEQLAETYERPLATLFMPQPPREEPQEQQFRRLPGSPEPPWPPEIRLLARRIRDRQDAAVELYETLEEEPPWPRSAHEFLTSERDDLPALARDVLGVSREEQESWPDGYAALRAWRGAIEELGVLVMQDGSLPVSAMRGFASLHETVPAIVANTKDDPRARAFTIVHELGHLALAVNGVEVGPQTEPWCNEFAGEVLMPPAWLREEFDATSGPLLARVEQIARVFRVTPLAAAVRIARSEFAEPGAAQRVIDEIRQRGGPPQPKRRGGDYYRNQIAGLGPGYIGLVFAALDTQAVTYPTASTLLAGVKVSNFDKLRAQLARRAELE